MEFTIQSIKHSGRRGTRYAERSDGRYPLRIGRTVDLDPIIDLRKDVPFVLNYVKDRDGSDMRGWSLRTSYVVDFKFDGDMLIVETNNSIYEMRRNRGAVCNSMLS